MSYLYADRCITRLRELLQDGRGTIRAITSTRLAGDLPPGLTPEEQRRRGIHAEKPVEVVLDGMAPHPQRLTQAGTLQIHLLSVTVRIARTIEVGAQLTDSLRDDVQAQAIIDANAVHDVLSWPPNLATTHAGQATGCIGARYLGSSARINGTAGAAQDLTTEHRYELTVTSAPSAT